MLQLFYLLELQEIVTFVRPYGAANALEVDGCFIPSRQNLNDEIHTYYSTTKNSSYLNCIFKLVLTDSVYPRFKLLARRINRYLHCVCKMNTYITLYEQLTSNTMSPSLSHRIETKLSTGCAERPSRHSEVVLLSSPDLL